MIVISHTLETGTVVYGTSPGDGTGEIIRRAGFRPSRSLADHPEYGDACWYVASTRRRPAKADYIDRCAAALRDAGWEVRIEIDNTTLPTTSFAQLEQERYDRAERRTDRFTAFADNAISKGSAMVEQVDQDRAQIPLGQPHLIGHHSYSRTVREEERRNAKERRGLEHVRRGSRWRERAGHSAQFQSGRQDLGTTLRRVERLEAEIRSLTRYLTGRIDNWEITVTNEWSPEYGTSLQDRLASRPEGSCVLSRDENRNLAEVLIAVGPESRAVTEAQIILRTEEADYWKEHVAALQVEEGIKVWSKTDFACGDLIRCGGPRWYEVVRVNPKTLSVINGVNSTDLNVVTRANARDARGGPGWTDKLPYHQVQDRMSVEQARSRFPEAFSPANPAQAETTSTRPAHDTGGSFQP